MIEQLTFLVKRNKPGRGTIITFELAVVKLSLKAEVQ